MMCQPYPWAIDGRKLVRYPGTAVHTAMRTAVYTVVCLEGMLGGMLGACSGACSGANTIILNS